MSLLQYLGRRLAGFLARPRAWAAHPATSPHARVAATLRKGDVLLVEGTSRFSSAIKYLTQSTWSHAALCIGDRWGPTDPDEPPRVLVDVDVIEGVRVIPLEAFSGLHTRICRPIGLAPDEIDRLIDFMLQRVGYMYDLKNILDLARYLIRTPPLPGRSKRRLMALGSGEPTRAICSTLLAQAFESIRYPILPEIEVIANGGLVAQAALEEILHIRHHSLYAPRDFDVSPFFQVIKPRLEGDFDFRRLVWSLAETPALPAVPPRS